MILDGSSLNPRGQLGGQDARPRSMSKYSIGIEILVVKISPFLKPQYSRMLARVAKRPHFFYRATFDHQATYQDTQNDEQCPASSQRVCIALHGSVLLLIRHPRMICREPRKHQHSSLEHDSKRRPKPESNLLFVRPWWPQIEKYIRGVGLAVLFRFVNCLFCIVLLDARDSAENVVPQFRP